MSLAAIVLCLYDWARPEAVPRHDEGWQAHLYQSLMVGQVPVTGAFLAMAWRRGLRRSLAPLGIQVTLWLLAAASVPVLGLQPDQSKW